MARYRPEPAYTHGRPARSAVVLVNLGTPAAPTAAALRPYLKQFLSDPRVVEIPRLLWWPILNGIILNTRPKKSAEKYASIWMPEGSPLQVYTERQAKLLAGYLLDGFATAAEQIAGRAVGARYRPAFDRAVKLTALWGFGFSGIIAVFFLVSNPMASHAIARACHRRALANRPIDEKRRGDV